MNELVFADRWLLWILVPLFVLWMLTLGAWWWSLRPRREVKEPPPTPVYKLQARCLKKARKAALYRKSQGSPWALKSLLARFGRF